MHQKRKRRMKPAFWIVLLLFIALIWAGFWAASCLNLLPKRSYTAADFGIETAISPNDADGDGIDDYRDIMLGARAFVETKPKYDGSYFAGGYPPEGIGVCTDVIWQGFLAAGLHGLQHLRRPAHQNDLHPVVPVGGQGAPDDLQRGVVPAHCVYDDLHASRTSCLIWSMMASERADSSAFLFRFPFTRWSRGGMMPKLMFMGWNSTTLWLLT